MSQFFKIFLALYVLAILIPVNVVAFENVVGDKVVKLDEGVSLGEFMRENNITDQQIEIGQNDYVLLKGVEANVLESADLYGVKDVQNDDLAYVQANVVPNDWFYNPEQWNMPKIGIESVWNQYKGSKKVVVAVLDTGFNYSHEDMRDLVWINGDEIAGNGKDDDNNGFVDDYNGYNFVSSSVNILDDNDHGTAVSSIIAANSNNEIGVAGINWQLTIMPVKVASSSGSASLFDIAQGIYYAVDNGAQIINMSLGSIIDKDYVSEAVDYAYDHNVLMVAAAGNSHAFTPDIKELYYPANYPKVMAVGATGRDDKIATLANSSFLSHHGPNLDLMAPGVEIVTADKGNKGYKYFDGTSMSGPHVAGTAALMLSKNSSLTANQLRDAINLSADKVAAMSGDFDERYGYGRLNVAKAMSMIGFGGDDDSDDNDDDDDNNNDDGDSDDQKYGTFWLAKWVSQSNYWYLKPGETREMWVEFQNVGDSLWEKNGANALHLATDRVRDRASMFYDSTTWLTVNRIEMKQDSVKPGEIARFEFQVKAPNYPINFKEYMALVSENNTWLNDMGVYWELNVTNENIYSAWWHDQSDYINMALGEKNESWIEFINNGTVEWRKDGYNALHLGTSQPLDRNSDLFDSETWLTKNRIELDQTVVLAGDIGRFSFDVAGNKKGFFREYFRPVAENISWLQDWGVYLDYYIDDQAVG